MMPPEIHNLGTEDIGTIWDYIEKYGPDSSRDDYGSGNWDIQTGYNLMEIEYD